MGEIIEDGLSFVALAKKEGLSGPALSKVDGLSGYQKISLKGIRITENQKTDVKISSKSTSKWRFCMLPSLFYSCRELSTNQPIFMQNKANLGKSQMNVNLIMTREYEKKSNRTFGENKPKQSQSRIGIPKAKILTRRYTK
jgi:hypothetical protein